MDSLRTLFICNVLLVLIQVRQGFGDEFLGCGGFVKSTVPIDFSKVEIKLLTPEGIQKYQTECAPNNGYYMVPFVDKGDFVLTVQPPKGWSFEPTSVELHVDGINDPCSQGRDINFEFLGFTISGQVSSVGSVGGGADGVTLTLTKENTKDTVSSTTSADGGKFQFSSVLPGSYKIVASHKSYTFQQKEMPITVTQSNVQCPSDIIVSGYDVHGKVSAAQLPVKDVHMLLFSDKAQKEIAGCNVSPPSGSEEIIKSSKQVFICSVPSNDRGSFTFPSLPPNDYTLVPFHKAEHIEFDVEPDQMKFTVTSGSVTLPQKFAVTGFSVTGQVIDSTGGNPVSGASVFVNGKEQAVTNEKGLYRLQHMNSGMYQITLKKEDIFFPESSVRVGSDTPHLPDIIANGFSLCGDVVIKAKPSKSFAVEHLSVTVINSEGQKKETKALNKDSSFCFSVAPGSYVLTPVVPTALEKSGIVIGPMSLKVQVQNKPIKDLKFHQVLIDIKATVNCIDNCGDVAVEMVRDGSAHKNKLKSKNTDGEKKSVEITFKDSLPGMYTIQAIQEEWCWQTNKTTIAVAEDSTNSVQFSQSGFKLTCSISHDLEMAIHHDEKLVDTFELKKGRNQLCLAKPGKYKLKPSSCHKFELSTIVYDTSHPQPVVMQAVSHQMTLKFHSTHEDKNLKVTIKSKTKGKEISLKLGDTRPVKSEDFVYTTHYSARDGEHLEITPESETLMFEPPSYTATVKADDCAKDLATFNGFQGLFIKGSVSPQLKDVDITISREEDNKIIKQLKTDNKGVYRVGPLHPKSTYSISAVKEGYVLIQNQDNPGLFVARKLSKIDFTVTMEESNEPLVGVLISVSGGSYRSNNLTDGDGNLALQKLEPGQYYFKAIMKEYEFKPSSQVTEVKEGDELKIAIKGKRTAFSCYGTVTSLNGQPESDITVQAFSTGPGLDHAEESMTNDQGMFRIKGLVPNTEYQVEVKKSDVFDRVSPNEATVVANNADVTDLRFIAFRSLSQFELSGNVVTDNEFLRSLKVVLYRTTDLVTPIHTASLTASPFFHLPSLPRDNQEYHIRLESSLDKSRYTYTEPAAGFFATGVYKHLTFQFNPEIKTIDHDTPQASYLALPVTILVILLFYNHTKVFNWVLLMSEKSYFANALGNRRDLPEPSAPTRIPTRKLRKEK